MNMNPNIAGRKPPSMAQLAKYNVNRANAVEVIWQPLYDFLAYPAAGQTAPFTFFQRSVGTAGTTLSDTNMLAAGQVPRPQEFLVTGIQVVFIPAGDAALGGQAVGVVQPNWVDVNAVAIEGNLIFSIGSKAYLREFPTGKFPPTFTIDGRGNRSDANVAAAIGLGFVDFARTTGRYYSITPVKIPANQNFDVTINFPALVAVDAAARLGVILDGFLYRLSQ